MSLVEDVKEWEAAEKDAYDKQQSIISFLNSAYEKYRKQIEEKTIAFWEKTTGEEITPFDESEPSESNFGMGDPYFTFSSRDTRGLAIDLKYTYVIENVYRIYTLRGTRDRVEASSRLGREAFENIKPELESFAKDIDVNVLYAGDQFNNQLKIVLEEGK